MGDEAAGTMGKTGLTVLYEPMRVHTHRKHRIKKHHLNKELTENVSRSSCSSGDWNCNNWRGDTQGLDHLIHWRVLDGDQVNGRLQRQESGGCGGEV